MKFLQEANFDFIEMLNFVERPFRAQLNPSKIFQELDRYINDETGLKNYCKKWRTSVHFYRSYKKSWKDLVAVGGEYDPESRRCEIHIYSSGFSSFKFTPKTWDRFKYKFIQTLMHEVIHFMQFDRRNDECSSYTLTYRKLGKKKADEEREYLSNFDEIQAYAHCVYLDMRVFSPKLSLTEFLNRVKTKRDSRTMHYFMKVFNYDITNNAAPRKLVDQIVKWDRKYKKIGI